MEFDVSCFEQYAEDDAKFCVYEADTGAYYDDGFGEVIELINKRYGYRRAYCEYSRDGEWVTYQILVYDKTGAILNASNTNDEKNEGPDKRAKEEDDEGEEEEGKSDKGSSMD